MKFSERQGIVKPTDVIQKEEMSIHLRSSIWNILDREIWQSEGFVSNRQGGMGGGISTFAESLWELHFKEPTDQIRIFNDSEILKKIRYRFFDFFWHEVYDFLEFVLTFEPWRKDVTEQVNSVLGRELAAYRLVHGHVTEIIDEVEIQALEEALADDDFPGVRDHLTTALEHLSRREDPDYRNSIKESISAVEAMARYITGDEQAVLGDALKELEKNQKLHAALKKGFSNLYGYASDEDGVRHAMMDDPNLTQADAKYMLVTCTAFVNYLKTLM